MAFLIIGMSFALIVGSLMWMLPSPKEMLLAKLRDNAIEAGFRPKFIKLDDLVSQLPKALQIKKSNINKKEDRQLLRYSWQGASPIKGQRELIFIFSELSTMNKRTLDKSNLVDDSLAQNTLEVVISNDEIIDQTEWNTYQKTIENALAVASYLEGLLAIELIDVKGKRHISLYWSEQGNIAKIDFRSQQIQALQKSR
jgi:hypothetical protein